ncbi:TPA: hypothetical protein ACWR61_005329, partial [Escherichia coli]
NVNTRSVTGGIARDSAVAAAGQVAGDIHTTTVSTVTVHGGVGQGAVAADVHTGAIAGGTAADDTVSDVAADVHTVAAAGGITRDSAVAAAGQVAGDIHTTTVSTVTVHHHVNQGGVAADVHSITVPRGNSGQGGCTIQTTGIYIYIFKANAISMLAHTSDTGVSSSG